MPRLRTYPTAATRANPAPKGGGGGGLPAWVAALSVGQWYELPNTGLATVEPAERPGNTGAFVNKIDAWNSLSVHPVTCVLYNAANGGHTDYAGNEVDALGLNVPTPAWVNLRPPTATVSNANHYADGRPTSRHSYYGQSVDVVNNRLMTWGGSRYSDGNPIGTVDSFRLSDNDWNAAGTHGDVPAGIRGGGSIFAFPIVVVGNGDVYAFGNFEVHRWNVASNTWTQRLTGQAPACNEAASAFDSVRNRVLILGGTSAESVVYDVAANSYSTVSRTGAEAANVLGNGNGMVYDAALDRFLLRKGASGGTVYQIHPTTWECTTLATTAGGSVPAVVEHPPYNRFLYVPPLGGCVYVPRYAANAWFLRTS